MAVEKKVVELDVRPEVDAGRDPFKTIMGAVSSLKEGETLHLINSFEPVPLYTVMKMKGFDHRTECRQGVWHVYFFKGIKEGPAGAPVKEGSACIERSENSACIGEPKPRAERGGSEKPPLSGPQTIKTIEIDVRGLEPPEPMVRVIETLPQVGKNDVLLVHHHMEPLMLYDKLEYLGFQASTEKVFEGYYKVRITKKP